MRNLRLCRRDFGIIPMMNFRREMHFMMNGEMEKRIHYSIAVVKSGKETKFIRILNMILLIKKGNYKAELLKMANSLYQK